MSAVRAVRREDAALDLGPFADVLMLKARALGVASRLTARRAARGETAELAGVVVAGADLDAVRQVERALAQVEKGARGAPAERARLEAQLGALGLRLTEAHQARAAERRMVETVRLDAAREGVAIEAVIERKRGVRQVRLRTRDGLKLLHERGGLGGDLGEANRLLAVGLRYRDLYERAGPRLRSSLEIDGAPVRQPRTFAQEVRAAHRRAGQSGVLRKWDALVARRLGDEALLALRAVAGEARTLRSLKVGSRRREGLSSLLRDALALLANEVAKGA